MFLSLILRVVYIVKMLFVFTNVISDSAEQYKHKIPMAGLMHQDVRKLEAKLGHCLVSIPMHPENKIAEGSAFIISKIELRGKTAAVKNFKQQLPMLKILKMACSLRELQQYDKI